MLKKITLLIFLLFILSSVFANFEVIDITLNYSERLNNIFSEIPDQLSKKIKDNEPKRLFLIENEEKKEYYLAIFDSQEHIEVFKGKPLAALTEFDFETVRAVRLYLSLQKSLQTPGTLMDAKTASSILLEDMSFVYYFSDACTRIMNKVFSDFKSKSSTAVVSSFQTELNRNLVFFVKNIEDFFENSDLSFRETIFQIDEKSIIQELNDFFRKKMENIHSQIEIDSIIKGYSVLLEGILMEKKEIFSGNADDLFRMVISLQKPSFKLPNPFSAYFVQNEKKEYNGFKLGFNLEIQKYLTLLLNEYLTELNILISKTYGSIDTDFLEKILAAETLFQIITYTNIKLILEHGTSEGIFSIAGLYLKAEEIEKKPNEKLDTLAKDIYEEIMFISSSLSKDPASVRLFQYIKENVTPKISYLPLENPVSWTVPNMNLISYIELEKTKGHFARIKTKIDTGDKEGAVFEKNYPIFSKPVTRAKDLIINDFFWFIFDNMGRSLLKALTSLVTSGFNIIELEQSLKASDVQMTLEGYVEAYPFNELWRMKPVSDNFIVTKLINNNPAKNAIMSLFGGRIPDFFASDVNNLEDTETMLLYRYPIEVYSPDISITSDEARNKNAIIFIHGKQPVLLFDSKGNPLVNAPFLWRNEGRVDVWANWFKVINENFEYFEDFDYYEFTYDTSILSAKEFGDNLAKSMETAEIVRNYDKIYFIAHSMGGLVARQAANTALNTENGKLLGEFLEKIVTIDTPHLGTLLQTFVLSINPVLQSAIQNAPFKEPPANITVFKLIQNLIWGEDAQQAVDLMIYFAYENPEIIGKLFSELTGALDPFKGGQSMVYIPEEYVKAVGDYFYGNLNDGKFKNIFLPGNELTEMNSKESFYDKLILVASQNKAGDKMSPGYDVIFGLMDKTASLVTKKTDADFLAHGLNDGVVPFFSQRMTGYVEVQERMEFSGIDHNQMPADIRVINKILEKLQIMPGGKE